MCVYKYISLWKSGFAELYSVLGCIVFMGIKCYKHKKLVYKSFFVIELVQERAHQYF